MYKNNIKLWIMIFIFALFVGREIYSSILVAQVPRINESKSSSIYFYSPNDDEIKNPELLDYFINNAKSGLNSSLTIYMVGDYEEEVMYGIIFEDSKYVVYTSVDGNIVDTKEFKNLFEYNLNNSVYYFLTNEEALTDELVNDYFDGDMFDLFEVGRKLNN